jgi:hypothetical protein
MTIFNILTLIISLAALTLAGYSLYLQRKDRKPVRKLEVTQADEKRGFGYDKSGPVLAYRTMP